MDHARKQLDTMPGNIDAVHDHVERGRAEFFGPRYLRARLTERDRLMHVVEGGAVD